MGLFANGILFGLQVLHTGHSLDVRCCRPAAFSLPRLHRMSYCAATNLAGAMHKRCTPASLWPSRDNDAMQPDALFVIIPALTLPRWAAVSYISMFVIGTVAAMGGYTAVIGD